MTPLWRTVDFAFRHDFPAVTRKLQRMEARRKAKAEDGKVGISKIKSLFSCIEKDPTAQTGNKNNLENLEFNSGHGRLEALNDRRLSQDQR